MDNHPEETKHPEDSHKKSIAEKVIQMEEPLTPQEEALDLRSMMALDLGEQQNYKTKIVQNRWQQHRTQWLKEKQQEDPMIVKNGIASKKFPEEDDGREGYLQRKRAKRTMKSVQAPYEPFQSFHPLEDVIDTYIEIWY